MGPAGSVFKVKGAVPLVLVKPPEKPRFIEYSFTVRDFSQFAVQVARAGLDPKQFPNSSIKAGTKNFDESNVSGDEAIGLGLRWPNVNAQLR